MSRRTHPARLLLALALAASAAAASHADAAPEPAPAADTEELKAARQKVFGEALAAMAAKNWGECRVKTLGAWAQRKHPQVASLLGLCEVELGLFRDGAEHLHYAIEHGEGEEPSRGPQVKAAYERALAKVAKVEVRAAQPGVELRLGDGGVVNLPATLFLEPGAHALEARLDGCVPKTESLTLGAGEAKTLDLALDPLPTNEEPGRRDDEPRAPKPLWPAIVLGGVGAVGVGLGVTGFVLSGGAYGDAEDAAAAAGPGGCGPDGSACADVQSSLDSANTMRGLGIGGFAVGGAALAGMVVYLLVPTGPAESGGWRLTPVIGSTSGLVLGGSF